VVSGAGSKRRAWGEGTIFKRTDGRWCARLRLPDGKRRDFYGKTQSEVRKRLTMAIRAMDEGVPIPGERETVGRFLGDWIVTVKPALRLQTWTHYERYLRLHAVPAIGRLPLVKLDRQHVHSLYAAKLREGLSATTVRQLHAILRRAVGDAVRWGLVSRNVVALVDPPRRVRHEIRPFTPEQGRVFMDAVTGDRLGALYVLAISTGMRQGELLALRWRDVDLDGGGVLAVRATVYRAEGRLRIDEPKTERSRRLVHLSSSVVAALRHHRERQDVERASLGDIWHDGDLVFPNTVGRPIEASNLLSRSYYPLLRRAGLPRIRFHDLRHSTATLLLGTGVHPKVVSDMLGHASIAITLDTYSHVTPGLHREAAQVIAALLAPPEQPSSASPGH
jgi:integrase